MQYRIVKMTSTYNGSVTYKLQTKCLFWWDDVYDVNPPYTLEEIRKVKNKLEERDSKKIYEVIE